MDDIRIRVIGVGGMGSNHVRWIKNDTDGAVVSAICDADPVRLEKVGGQLDESVPRFQDADELFDADVCDAVMIATPHYDHPPLEDYLRAIYCIERTQKVAWPKDISAPQAAASSTVTVTFQSLAERGMVNYEPYELITLTDEGHERAEQLAVRHRIDML